MKRIFCLLGASASGKTTLGEYLKNLGINEIVSHTTRKPREGEEEGVTYYYVDDKEFNSLEKIEEVEYSGNRYCISKKEVEEKLNNHEYLFLIADKNGVEQLKKIYNDIIRVVYVYSTPLECYNRLRERDGLLEAKKRLEHAAINKEFNNHDIADYIIRSKDGELNKIRAQMKNIVSIEIVECFM